MKTNTLTNTLFRSDAAQRLLAFAGLIIMFIVFSLASPNFLQWSNIKGILLATSVNGVLALDNSIGTKQKSSVDSLQLVYPGGGPVKFELHSTSAESFTLAAVTWHDLPSVLIAPFMGNWPDEAQPYMYGPRAEKIQEFKLSSVEHSEASP